MLRHIVRAFIAAFFPTKCLVCGSFFHIRSFSDNPIATDICFETTDRQNLVSGCNQNFFFGTVMARFLCSTCASGFLSVESPMCSRCGVMFTSRVGEDHVCGECLNSPKRFRIARASGVYDRTLMSLIHCFKYKGKLQLARPLGMLLFLAFINSWDKSSIDLIVPVPLHIKKLRQRGFNQAYLLIRDWQRIAKTGTIELPSLQTDKDVLIRSRWTEPQTGLDRKKRMANIKNAFTISDPTKIADKRILLVDDVCTTGATADECAKVLLKAGARHVDVLTLARAI